MSPEGRRRLRSHYAIERSRKNRKKVLATRGYGCEACGFVFGQFYGSTIAEYAEVHHVNPVSLGVQVPELADFVVLCANCHRTAHYRVGDSPRTLQQLKLLIST